MTVSKVNLKYCMLFLLTITKTDLNSKHSNYGLLPNQTHSFQFGWCFWTASLSMLEFAQM